MQASVSKVGQPSFLQTTYKFDVRRHWRGVAWRGVAWRGVAWRGVAWRGVAWRGVAWRGVAWRGVAWRGVAMNKSEAFLITYLNMVINERRHGSFLGHSPVSCQLAPQGTSVR